jgi:hypothetical protein
MSSSDVYIEAGKRKAFAGALDWPGWCRGGRDEESALQNLFEVGPRYGLALQHNDIAFNPPESPSGLVVVERLEGNVTTDFGAPAMIPDADNQEINPLEYEHFKQILLACWKAFDQAVQNAVGRELQKGPRGGGRDLDKIIHHVYEADLGYLRRINWRHQSDQDADPWSELKRSRQAILAALDSAVNDGFPARGPRGGKIWTPRYYIRRVAWHVLDHAWEIEDRVL